MNEIAEQLVVAAEEHATRLDRWLTDALLELDYPVSRTQVQAWIANGFVRCDGMVGKRSLPVESGQTWQISVPASTPARLQPQQLALDLVFEDSYLLVVNKPRGLVVHPGAGHESGTLVHGLLGREVQLSDLGGQLRPGIVHRIDKDTSGLLVVAKTDLAYLELSRQLRGHTMERLYVALVQGRVPHAHGSVDAPIGRDRRHRQRMAVIDHGKSALTHFRVIEHIGDCTLLELRLETGRTHQIRVHMQAIGFPLIGDPLYGHRQSAPTAQAPPLSGQALHAATLGFVHPQTGETLRFESPLPPDLHAYLEFLRAQQRRGGGSA